MNDKAPRGAALLLEEAERAGRRQTPAKLNGLPP